jgi:hypothetical protein
MPLAETREPVVFEVSPAAETVRMTLQMRLGRVALAGIRCGIGGTAETGWTWRRRAAPQAAVSTQHLRRHLPGTQGPLDERWNGSARPHARETALTGNRWPDGEDGRQWGWGSVAPEWRGLMAAVVGPRTLDTAKAVVAATQARGAGRPPALV